MWGFVARSHFNTARVRGAACSMLLLIGGVAGLREAPIIQSSAAVAGEVKSQNAPAEIFASVLLDIKKKTRVPVLLPGQRQLWSLLHEPTGLELCANAEADATGYSVSLDSSCPSDGNAGFVASFEGTLKPGALSPYDPSVRRRLAAVSAALRFEGGLPRYDPSSGDKRVKLARGIKGVFSPVSCGGSCAPAALWWRERGVWYEIRVHDHPTPEDMTAVANSAILGRPR
jgi:hypothetical protein